MAFTKTPTQSTDQTKNISFAQTWETRDYTNNKDVDSVNCIFELVNDQSTGDQYWEVIKREGFIDTTATGNGNIDGAYYWKNFDLYVVAGTTGTRAFNVADNLSTNIAWNAPTATFGAVAQVRFVEFLFDNGDVKLIATDGSNIFMFDNNGVVTTLTGTANLPAPHKPYPVFLDGYLFLADARGNIWNSNLNDPTVWSASAFLTAESYPDIIQAIARQGVYIVGFGTTSIEFFYDAGNPTGSPLARYSSNVPRVGFRGGLADLGDSLYFIGIDNNSKSSAYELSGLKLKNVGNQSLTRVLETRDSVLDVTSRTAGILNINGHKCYVFADPVNGSAALTTHVYYLDLETNLWSRFTSSLNNAQSDFPLNSACTIETVHGTFTIFTIYASNKIYQFSKTTYQDLGANFTVQFVTKNEDFGTRRNKFGSRILMVCDQTSSASNMSVSWSDDDYQTFSTPRTMDVSSTYPHIYALGSFRKRAHKVTYADNFPMRWTRMEIDYDQGSA